MTSKKKKHKLHTYQRITMGEKHVIYRCVDTGCTHTIPLALMIGRPFLCFECKTRSGVITNKKELTNKLRCETCRGSRNVNPFEVLRVLGGLINAANISD